MKLSNFVWTMVGVMAFASCSNNEVLDDSGQQTLPGVATGQAYITVRLQDAGAMKRGTDGGYENGEPEEHKVMNAKFYFFDRHGAFVEEGTAWNGGNPVEGDENVEFKSNTVVVLKGVTEKNYPTYLLTVLNAPDFTLDAASTLESASRSLQQWYVEQGTETKEKYFVMSTSSYVGNASETYDPTYYYANKINPKHFKEEPVENNTTGAMDIYVERLAAKVETEIGMEPIETTSGGKIYKVENKVSIGGGGNNDGGEGNEAATQVYVKFTNWALNATANNSWLSKQLQDGWVVGSMNPFVGWNMPNDYRCYWAASRVYGLPILIEDGSETLHYITYKDLTHNGVSLGDAAYCNENTNTAANIMTAAGSNIVDSRKTTSVILGATLCNEKGEAIDAVRHNGLVYLTEEYLKHVAFVLNQGISGGVNIYTRTAKEGEGETGFEYTQINIPDFLKIGKTEDGMLKVVVDGTKFEEGTEYYQKKFEEVEGVEEDKSEKITDPAGKLAEYIAQFVTNMESGIDAENSLFAVDEVFKNGAMYYSIPVQHMVEDGEADKIVEGEYGVVRNHWYQLSINKVKNIGTGIFDPDEDEMIKPEIPDTKLYLDATINILSWKVVTQGVEL